MIKLNGSDGTEIFINPKYVVSIEKSKYSPEHHVYLIDHYIVVKELAEEILWLMREFK